MIMNNKTYFIDNRSSVMKLSTLIICVVEFLWLFCIPHNLYSFENRRQDISFFIGIQNENDKIFSNKQPAAVFSLDIPLAANSGDLSLLRFCKSTIPESSHLPSYNDRSHHLRLLRLLQMHCSFVSNHRYRIEHIHTCFWGVLLRFVSFFRQLQVPIATTTLRTFAVCRRYHG